MSANWNGWLVDWEKVKSGMCRELVLGGGSRAPRLNTTMRQFSIEIYNQQTICQFVRTSKTTFSACFLVKSSDLDKIVAQQPASLFGTYSKEKKKKFSFAIC